MPSQITKTLDIKEIIQKKSSELKNEIIDLRRHLHMHPELSFEEYQTSLFICNRLDKIGVEYRKVACTGVIGTIKGELKNNKVIAIRAEMDALPVKEMNLCYYSSSDPGKMHACGHDAHMAMLLGIAELLNNIKENFGGTILLIFQPGEELAPGGASLIIESGALNDPRPDLILAQHVLPELETGKVGYKAGYYMASSDEIYITVKGKGGHAALPGLTTDQLYIASNLIIRLKERMLKEQANNRIPTVLGIGRFIGEGATNVIPEKVEIAGTFRTFDEKWRSEGQKIIKAIAAETAEEFDVKIDVRIAEGYPVLINDQNLTEKAMELSSGLLGKDNVETFDIRMSSDDFSFYSKISPSLYLRIGIRKKGEKIRMLHTAEFDIDEDCLQTGIANMSWLVYNLLSDSKT